MPAIDTDVATEYPDYLRDESRMEGQADSISFPTTEIEIRDLLADMSASGTKVTTQGARSGITGGAVPNHGHILNLSHMTRVLGLRKSDDEFYVTVQPGLTLGELREMLEKKEFDTAGWSDDSLNALDLFRQDGPWFFPPDPTETSAAIGGMVGNNASGACSFKYGPTRNHVERLRAVLSSGEVVELKRGDNIAIGREFAVTTEDGSAISGTLPSYHLPDVKNAAGYYANDNMDVIDLFIGSEGTLAVYSEIELKLTPAPVAITGVTAFLPSEESALSFVQTIREGEARPAAIEFFDSNVLNLLRDQKANNPAFDELPEIPSEYHTAVYVEYHGTDEDQVDEGIMCMCEAMAECGGDEDATWIASGGKEMERLKAFRHAVPEAVNLLVDNRRKSHPELTKLGTDMAVPGDKLPDAMALYHEGLARKELEYVIFGHIGDNHVHVNILPADMVDYDKGKVLYIEWAGRIVAMGGTVSAEHGIGKLKTAVLTSMYGADGIDEMRDVKLALDPQGILNSGNLFES